MTTDIETHEEELVQLFVDAIQKAFKSQETFPCNAENLRITTLETKVASMDVDLQKVEERVRGNGHEGLESRTKRNEVEIDQIKEFIQEIKSIGKWLILLVAGLLTTSLISLILK